MTSPLFSSEYSPRPRNRPLNSSLLPMNSGSYSTISRMIKQRNQKEEISIFYARQCEGLPHIPKYLSNSIYAHLVREQFNLFNKINESEQDTATELTCIEKQKKKNHHIIDDRLAVPFYERLSISSTRKKTPSAKEYSVLSALVNQTIQDLRLPTAWDVRARHELIEASPDNMQLTYTGDGKDDSDVASVRANHAIRKQCGIYYFEIKVISKGTDGHIGIGFCRKINSLNRFPGWGEHSWGYHGENGNIYAGPGTEKAYGPSYGTGDIIGCGIDFRDMSAFYTKNGLYLGTAFKNIKDTDIYPFVGFKTPKEQIEANFGLSPFKFDIQQYMTNKKREAVNSIVNQPTQKKKPRSSVINNSICKNNADNLIMEYLRHSGYHKSAMALENTMKLESEQVDSENVHRQDIRECIFSGDIDKAIYLCNTHYSSVLQDNPFIEFKLQCRKFMEMVKRAQLNQNKPATNNDEYEAQSLQVSKGNNKRTTSHANLDFPNLKNKKQRFSEDSIDTLQSVMEFGNALMNRYGPQLEKNRLMNSELLTAFSTLAYTDLSNEAVAYLYQTPYIEIVASELNSAILVSLGKYPNSSIERIYRQTTVTIEELVLGGNAKAALLDPEHDCLKMTDM
ncbi:hypothetical protein BDF21DRAFT_447511 [Thamnidium elegans]|nr:hypothetical protein BDF21DRAFT_447511 [Thamnidium elegans]